LGLAVRSNRVTPNVLKGRTDLMVASSSHLVAKVGPCKKNREEQEDTLPSPIFYFPIVTAISVRLML